MCGEKEAVVYLAEYVPSNNLALERNIYTAIVFLLSLNDNKVIKIFLHLKSINTSIRRIIKIYFLTDLNFTCIEMIL